MWDLISAYHVFNGYNKTISANFNVSKSPWNFNIQYQGQAMNVTDNFLVSNSVSAPANAMATNTNSDNDMITNTAMNAGGRRRRKRMISTILQNPFHNALMTSIQPTRVVREAPLNSFLVPDKYQMNNKLEEGRSFLFGIVPLIGLTREV